MTKITLEELASKHKFYHQNPNLTTKNFPPPETIATENWQVVEIDKTMTSEEVLDLIKSKGLRPANVYELLKWKENYPTELKKNKYYVAMGQLWEDVDGHLRVPVVIRFSDGDWRFDLRLFEFDWDDVDCLLCVCDLSLDTK